MMVAQRLVVCDMAGVWYCIWLLNFVLKVRYETHYRFNDSVSFLFFFVVVGYSVLFPDAIIQVCTCCNSSIAADYFLAQSRAGSKL